MNGFEFLQELRSDQKLRDTVVFVLTTSGADSDRTRAYQENIAGYMVKSAVGPQFSKLVKLLDDYHSTVQLP
jgi:CheY-like chemotaxis protein